MSQQMSFAEKINAILAVDEQYNGIDDFIFSYHTYANIQIPQKVYTSQMCLPAMQLLLNEADKYEFIYTICGISPNDLEQIITAAILIGVKKYSMRHPGLRKTIDDILGTSYGEYAEYDQEYAEIKQTGTKKRTASKRPASTRKSKKK